MGGIDRFGDIERVEVGIDRLTRVGTGAKRPALHLCKTAGR
jgi:hypothetical protein